MQYDALRSSLLEARDRRQALLDSWFPAPFPATLMLSLNLPGDEKSGERAERLFRWGESGLLEALPVLCATRRSDQLGPFALYRTGLEAGAAKLIAIALESGHPAGRLLDLDIYDPSGRPLNRAALELPPRSCLLCPEPALACIRANRHTSEALKARAQMVIDAL
ncbi:MAG: apo-citrate lyase phosphoribosyl-dephospho-CoA transferase [Geobacteraceae bacterium GWC2_58_44]|nr:MAG: apo-citrate lyase phosphoribosyl-dephospho-CoA transferase [Geobacteraceae bacterium GWC2_58_44]